MKKLTAAALVITAFATTPLFTLASNDREEIEAACRQAVVDENVEMLEIKDYIADCIAMNLVAEQGEGVEDKEETTETTKTESE